MGYKFRLESILKLNIMDVNKSANELKEREHFYKIEQTELDKLTKELDNIGNRTCSSVFTLRNEMLYKESLRERIEVQNENVNLASQKVNLAHSDLMKAQVKKKSLEKLKEREIEDYQAHLEYKERQELDRVATIRHNYTSILGAIN